jgi:UDP-N-acetylmuramate--alanine ligase
MKLSARHVHFVGIGGIGVSGLARLLLARGLTVSGSDLRDGTTADSLRRLGAQVIVGHAPGNIPPATDLVVASAAIPSENVELCAGRERGLRVLKYAQALGLLMEEYAGIAIAGTHGKTTTTSLVAYLLGQVGFSPSFVVGAEVPQLGGNSGFGRGPHLVVEACEYDRSFLNYHPTFAVITNIEEDHLDYYRDVEDIIGAFAQFASQVQPEGRLLVNGRDARALRAARSARAPVESFAVNAQADWSACDLQEQGGFFSFTASHAGEGLGRFQLAIPGAHYVDDALAAIALAMMAGGEVEGCRQAVAEFHGARRRFERLGELAGVQVVDDYAHHPTEIRVTLRAARQSFPGARIWCVFQPHQYSRTRTLLGEFARSFDDADRVLLLDIYLARDSEELRHAVSSADLARAIRENGRPAEEVRYLATFSEIEEVCRRELNPGDVLITMGAGDVWKLGYRFLQSPGTQSPTAGAPGPLDDAGRGR